ncbi:transcription antitermination factor NusB [Paraburkholderia gardini]|uniref:Transcription antitermination protein NusB n=1 Tax=Paraburkholderia gardini TaxID=2823469 RepID=A0ABM8U1L4_9BURK|nr:transcription antitermination factor NusB [Paraburkholderia gardini]CAG4894454.1 Transcription antitermination protein NusB [Paraburkholderia gardini]CAG4912966.1 Transcription antitermination protein NusB [Paraburkholderia gardini]
MKSARRRSRELATQGLYQWLLSGSPIGEIDAQLRGAQGYDKADHAHLEALLSGVIRDSEALSIDLMPCLDRPIDQLSPVERAVLLVAAFELKNHVDIPYRVVINEAVELAKTFGGADGYKYVNGVLDKLSVQLRAAETQAARKH